MGGTMPGAPALLVGRNPDLAWSATYTFMDGTDSWIEKCKDGKYLHEPGKWVNFIEREEIIKRKKKDPVKVVFYENKHGILEGNPKKEGYYLTTSWASAFSGAATLDSIIKMFDAKTVTKGMDLLGRVETSWNFILADKKGNIGYQMSGLMPKRRKGVTGFVPLPGWEEKNDWQGFEPLQDLPRCYNPECGFFVTTNQNLNEYGKVDPINAGMGPYRSDRVGKNGFGTKAVEHIDKHTGIFNDFYINFDRILLSETSVWFGNKTREGLYLKAARKALESQPENWGDTRKVIMKNILFDGKLPKFLGFDRGPITLIGSLATPHQGQIFESAGRQTTFAPGFRMVIDLSTDEMNTNMAGGPSDRRFSKWYCSDIENWISGKYKTISANSTKKYKL